MLINQINTQHDYHTQTSSLNEKLSIISHKWAFYQLINDLNKPQKYINVNNIKNTNTNTHLPQEKFYFDEFNHLCPKWDFEQTNENPTKLWNYRRLKTLIKVVQKFDKILAKIYHKPIYNIPIKVLPWT